MSESMRVPRISPVAPAPARVSYEFETDEGPVIVLVRPGPDGPLVTSSDGDPGGPYAQEALRLYAGASVGTLDLSTTATGSLVPPPMQRTSSGAPAPQSAIARELEGLVTAIVRAGVRAAEDAPGVQTALERLLQHVPTSAAGRGLPRWLGRLRAALDDDDLPEVATLLDGASALVLDLRDPQPSAAAEARICAWLGWTQDHEPERRVERRLVEVGRERLYGVVRDAIERRYLMDLGDGVVYAETLVVGEGGGSVGPVPRVLELSLGLAESSLSPPGLRPLQYVVDPSPGVEIWAHVARHALRAQAEAALALRDAEHRIPGLAEPAAVFAPTALELERGRMRGEDGGSIALVPAAPGAIDTLASAAVDAPLSWLAGRLCVDQGVLALAPCAAAFGDATSLSVVRLT